MIVAEDICMKYRQVFKEVVALKNMVIIYILTVTLNI